MRLLIQRVSQASVHVDGELKSSVGKGLLVFVGIGQQTTGSQLEAGCRKLLNLRIFADAQGLMNLNVQAAGGDLLLVSQFTLYANTNKGNRPSFVEAAPSAQGLAMFNQFHALVEAAMGKAVGTGVFGADMQVHLVNDGPVTIWWDAEFG